ncbi:glycosyltransferase, partial [Salmonella enterica]
MNEQPLISVIVPVYNVEQSLDRCVRSIVAQTYR